MTPKKFNSLVVIENQNGHFYKASFQGLPITEKELFERILKTKKESGFRISHYVEAFAKTNRNFNVLMQEQDVS
jgi:hypothetical protein